MVWQRLEECYGSPEAIEDALLKKIEAFPKLTNKDSSRLRELGDILLELQCALPGTLPGLAYLDTARGVQIVEKLPFNMQERWTTVGTKYKETHSVSFPPFSVFVQFVQQQAKMRMIQASLCLAATVKLSHAQKNILHTIAKLLCLYTKQMLQKKVVLRQRK